jgi:hypothetical protein
MINRLSVFGPIGDVAFVPLLRDERTSGAPKLSAAGMIPKPLDIGCRLMPDWGRSSASPTRMDCFTRADAPCRITIGLRHSPALGARRPSLRRGSPRPVLSLPRTGLSFRLFDFSRSHAQVQESKPGWPAGVPLAAQSRCCSDRPSCRQALPLKKDLVSRRLMHTGKTVSACSFETRVSRARRLAGLEGGASEPRLRQRWHCR